MSLKDKKLYKIVKERLFYDKKTGELIWKKLNPKCRRTYLIGKIAGTLCVANNGNYKSFAIKLEDKRYQRSNLVFLFFNKRLPKEIDHINGIPTDDRIENLRECTRSQNMANLPLYKKRTFKKTNKKLPFGIRMVPNKYSKYAYRLQCNKKYIQKSFKTLKECRSEYIKKRKELFGEFFGRLK